ncbi:hypothetical protein PENSPDRAFT_311207 [Peniophora sp. CONT]|nr:hypothetical protein PENSPDRAFT_311207 [Peniophora sp. CONT]
MRAVLSLSLVSLSYALSIQQRDNGFTDPASWLTNVPATNDLHEPINIVISADSDDDVLNTNLTTGGAGTYFQSFGYSYECLGQHQGVHQSADLADGRGAVNETAVIRWDYGDVVVGTCKETVNGGAHFRYWAQDGSKAKTGALFLAASYEQAVAQGHGIVPNGYNLGRDWLVGNATTQSSLIPTAELTSGATYSGETTASNYTYSTSVQYISGLASNTSDGINHADSVSVNGAPANDGLVAVLTVKILSKPKVDASSAGSRYLRSGTELLLYTTAYTLLAIAAVALMI